MTIMIKRCWLILICIHTFFISPAQTNRGSNFPVRGFHLDLRIQVMTMPALRNFAAKLKQQGMNTLIMEWEGTYPFKSHPMIPNRYAYTKNEIDSFIRYCTHLGIDVIPLQQSFGHVEYILRNYRYRNLREDQKDYSQVCPLEIEGNRQLFTDLFSELAASHPSKYFHIGGDETYLLGHCPKCSKKAALEGTSKLYIDHIRMLCDIVMKLGKRPVLWADIALKYPEAIHLLPKETIFIDWNYGWDINRFGDHQKLMDSGYEIWGSPSLRSHPDNYFITQWQKHFNNIRDFIPAARKFGYKGMIMTSWSTSGQYSTVNESETDIIDLYAIRHVYPISGFNILFDAFASSLRTDSALQPDSFIEKYASEKYGLSSSQATLFRKALLAAPYEVIQGNVSPDSTMPISSLLDSAKFAAGIFHDLHPSSNSNEFEHYRLMSDIRVQYLAYQEIEHRVNQPGFSNSDIPTTVAQLKTLLANAEKLDARFTSLNSPYFNPEELRQENILRNSKTRILYARLARLK